MEYKNFVTSFVRSWNFVRSETLNILDSLDDEKLLYRPEGEKWQPLYWEFGCIGRTQLVYADAIKTEKMNFSLFHSDTLPTKVENKTKGEIQAFLEQTDKIWIEAIRARRMQEDFLVKWPGFNQPLPTHISALISHERLHHGQFISYFTLAGFELPKEFKLNWAL